VCEYIFGISNNLSQIHVSGSGSQERKSVSVGSCAWVVCLRLKGSLDYLWEWTEVLCRWQKCFEPNSQTLVQYIHSFLLTTVTTCLVQSFLMLKVLSFFHWHHYCSGWSLCSVKFIMIWFCNSSVTKMLSILHLTGRLWAGMPIAVLMFYSLMWFMLRS